VASIISTTLSSELPYISIGDIVRYYDLDGGKEKGQVLVGKATFVYQKTVSDLDKGSIGDPEWIVEIEEFEDIGQGYFSEYSSRKSKHVVRNLKDLAPVIATYVRSADAYKIPFAVNSVTGNKEPLVSYENYRLDGFDVPKRKIVVNQQMLDNDMENYLKLKGDLLRDACVAGLIGALLVEFFRGTEDAVCYSLGAAAGVAYLFFLTLKTDSIGSPGAKFGIAASSLRFLMPFFVLLGISASNIATGVDDEILSQGRFLSTVKVNQFASVTVGFLTYRIPLFLRQFLSFFSGTTNISLPGSAAMAMEMMQSDEKSTLIDLVETQKPVLLVCGPSGTGKTSLVNRLIEESDGRFVRPKLVDRVAEGARYEIMESRGAILKEFDKRYSLTAEGVLSAADSSKSQAVVIDADTELAAKLKSVAGARIIGVWVGLDSLDKLKTRIRSQIQSNIIQVPNGETEDSFIRGKIRRVVKDIEFGVVSGMFEFTILNDDFEHSLNELKAAGEYCFK